MDIRQFSPQTQRTLQRMDYNQDQKLSARELQNLKTVPSAPGIDQNDLLKIQTALKSAQSPAQTLVSIVDDHLPPGYTAPAPLFAEPGSQKPKKAGSAPAASAAAAPDTAAVPKKAKAPKTAADNLFKMTASSAAAKKDQPTPSDQGTGEVQATSQLGALQLKGSSQFKDSQYSGSKINAKIEAAPNYAISLGLDADSVSTPASTGKSTPKTGSKGKTPTKPAAPADSTDLSLNGQLNAGALKLGAKGKIDQTAGQIKDPKLNASLELLAGQELKGEAKLDDKGLAVSKVGSAHKLYTGLSLTSSVEFDTANGKVKKHGGGFSYSAAKDSAFEGLSFSAEALAKTDTVSQSPLKGWEQPELKFQFRFSRPFS